MAMYFIVLLAFAAASFLLEQPVLAAVEAGATTLLFVFYQVRRVHRRKALMAYIQSATDNLETAARGEIPLPMALVRLVGVEIVWSNR